MIVSLALLACVDPGISEGPPADDSVSTDDSAYDPDDAIRAIDPTLLPAGNAPCQAPRLARVVYVVDGDTAHVKPDGGGVEETLRFIGLDAPELAHNGDPAECYGVESSDFVNTLLAGELVWLTFDDTCYDRYDRTLAYLHLGTREEDFVNRTIVRSGYAWAYPFSDTPTFEAEFDADEADARQADRGMWGACPGL